MAAVQMILAFTTALAFTVAAVPLVIRAASAYGLYDLPDGYAVGASQSLAAAPARRVHSRPVPRLGGIAIVLSFFLTHVIWVFAPPLRGVFLGSLVIFATGLADDLWSLKARTRLFVQVLLAGLTVWACHLSVTHLALTPSWDFALPSWLGLGIGAFIIVGSINAINMIDGLDGLAGGVVLIGVALLSFVHFLRTHDVYLILALSVPLIGVILGFLRYNTFPASIFMGDSGSNWLGFMVGALILLVLGDYTVDPSGATSGLHLASVSVKTPVLFISVIMCLALPIFDTACVMLLRVCKGVSPMTPDKRHFHHTLLRLGLSHSQSVTAVYFLALVFGILGITPVAFPQYSFWWVPYTSAALLAATLPLGLMAHGKALDRLMIGRAAIQRSSGVGRRLGRAIRLWETTNRYFVYAIILVSPLLAGVAPKSVGYAALMAAILLFVSLFSRTKRGDFIESLLLSLGAGVLLAANNQNTLGIELLGHRYNIQFLYNGIFTWLFCSTVAFVVATFRLRYFLITPSDFLLATLPLIILLVPAPYLDEYRLNIIALRCLVLFMVLRTMAKRRNQTMYRVRLVTILALSYVVMTSLVGLRIVY